VINIYIGGYGHCGIAACCGRIKRILYITKLKTGEHFIIRLLFWTKCCLLKAWRQQRN